MEFIEMLGSLAGGFGACWAAWLSLSTARENNKRQDAADLKSHKLDQKKAQTETASNYDAATNLLLEYQPEFMARVRSLKRRHRSEGHPKTVTDLETLSDILLHSINDMGMRFNKDKESIFGMPTNIISDWRLEEIKSRDVIGQARSIISNCRYRLNEYENDLNNSIN